jgi:hypothetical protein
VADPGSEAAAHTHHMPEAPARVTVSDAIGLVLAERRSGKSAEPAIRIFGHVAVGFRKERPRNTD